jgi:hypothetical protein
MKVYNLQVAQLQECCSAASASKRRLSANLRAHKQVKHSATSFPFNPSPAGPPGAGAAATAITQTSQLELEHKVSESSPPPSRPETSAQPYQTLTLL